MAYRALYRQWRPKDFSHVVGQKSIIETLRNQVTGDRIAHAYLFCGSRGTGKTSTAKILARAINCEQPRNGDPCGVCPNCVRMENDESLDIIEIDAASNNGVDEIRDLRDTVKYPPQFGRYKVYIIDEVHMLSTSAFNALLKTLEEPPAYIVFILATTEPQKLPETILSRCQRFDFGRIAIHDLLKRLREAADGTGASVSDGALMAIARSAEGGMRDALSILDMCLGYGNEISEEMVRNLLGSCDRQFQFGFADALAQEDAGRLFRYIDRLMREGRDPAVFIRDMSYHVRVLLMAKCCPEDMGSILDLTAEDVKDYLAQAESFTVTRLMTILDLFMKTETEMRFVSSPRLALENVCLKCCIRTQEADSRALNDRIDELEKKLTALAQRIDEGSATVSSKKRDNQIIRPESVISTASETEEKTLKKEKKEEKPSSDVQGIWKKLMERFAKEQPSLWSLLSQGNIKSPDKGTVSWQPKMKEGSEFFVISLNRDEKRKIITDSLKEITGMDYTFQATAYTENKTAADNSDEAYIKTLYAAFGKEPVDIVDRI